MKMVLSKETIEQNIKRLWEARKSATMEQDKLIIAQIQQLYVWRNEIIKGVQYV